jgi:hypothetical protein
MTFYSHIVNTVLRRPIESTQYTAVTFASACRAAPDHTVQQPQRLAARQRCQGALLRLAGEGATAASHVRHPRAGAQLDLPVHRGVLQPLPPALRARLPLPRRGRARSPRHPHGRGLTLLAHGSYGRGREWSGGCGRRAQRSPIERAGACAPPWPPPPQGLTCSRRDVSRDVSASQAGTGEGSAAAASGVAGVGDRGVRKPRCRRRRPSPLGLDASKISGSR